MRRLLLFGFFALASAYGAGCDRACLKGVLDQYLNAVVQHNPAAAPLTVGFRQAESEQAGYFGTLEEEGGAAVATVRLKIDDRKISEAEWHVARKGDPGIGVG